MAVASLLLSALLSATVPMGVDSGGRPTMDVQVNGQGPFKMVVDTAAQTSLLSQRLVDALKLQPLDEQMTVRGAVSAQVASIYPVEELRSGLFHEQQLGMLALPSGNATSADGIIGMERFTGGKLVFRPARRELALSPSAAVSEGYVAVVGKRDDGGLLHVPMRLGGATAMALVDTGAGPTVANLQTLDAMGWQRDDPRLKAAGTIRGATEAMIPAWIAEVDAVSIGPVTFRNVPVVFADTGPETAPAVILGANLLGLLQGFAVDFPRAELQVEVPGAPGSDKGKRAQP